MLFPAVRWSESAGFADAQPAIERALGQGVGGFILFGGPAGEVRKLTDQLQSASSVPLLIAADLERGAAQQFAGATPLPPAAALGWLDDIDVTRRAGDLTAREALALGVNWVYAPVADVDLEPLNPIVGTRSFGTSAERVAEHVAAWVEGCHNGGALACAKHFPGHGRTITDSHTELPRVNATRADLEHDLTPFRVAVKAGVDSVMTAHVSYPAYDASGLPATLSPRILQDVLRDRLEFDGIIVTDALNMEGVHSADSGEARAGVVAVQAGCDALLYPDDVDKVAEALERAAGKQLPNARIDDALRHIEQAAARARGARTPAAVFGTDADAEWTLNLAQRTLQTVRGIPSPGESLVLMTIDDDTGGPWAAPARSAFPDTLRMLGTNVTEGSWGKTDIVAVYCDIRAWKGRPGLSAESLARASAVIEKNPDALIVLFAHPRLATALPGSTVLAAWGGEPLMQQAAAHWLINRR
jgi:beta-glucosidase-like glycosyl hydrolase